MSLRLRRWKGIVVVMDMNLIVGLYFKSNSGLFEEEEKKKERKSII